MFFPCSLKTYRFPVYLLPHVVNPPAVAGYLCATWKGIHRGTMVGVAMGDMQCAILAAQPSLSDAGIKYHILASQHSLM